MKCPCCNGTGRTPMVTIIKTDSGLPCDFPCIACDGTGEVEMTNKYFLQTATTEQLAWFIAKAMLFYDNTTMSLLEAIKKAIEYDEKPSKHFTDDIVEWLKQPHSKE